MADAVDKEKSPGWAAEYFRQEELRLKNQTWKSLLHPSVFGACLAIAGRIIFGPIAMLLLFTATKYLTDATVLIKPENSFLSFTEQDLSMAGGCTNCISSCKISLLKYALFKETALTSTPSFSALVGKLPTESLYDFSPLSAEALALAESLDQNGALCQSGINDWGAITSLVTGSTQAVFDVIKVLNISVSPLIERELELGVQRAGECVTNWSMMGITRLFYYPSTLGTAQFGRISAATVHVYPDYTECRPDVDIADSLTGSKLAHATDGVDPLAMAPDVLKLYPYSFTSSLPAHSRVVAALNTKYGTATVLQPHMHAYYGGCRVREVNTTGIYIESSCEISTHWLQYGLMVQAPENVPLCNTGGVCVRNYYNTEWELISTVSSESSNRLSVVLNTVRTRYADTVAVSVLPGVVVAQILFMGVISLYQVMSHKRSVLLTQIWAYRCQNGRMQVLYIAQITYHLVYNSDLYWLGLATGTLTEESIANIAFCFFAFSYSFVNLMRARSGDQQLDRHFRLTWEAMQVLITAAVVVILEAVQHTPLVSIIQKNAQILRKSSASDTKYCGLNDSCILFTVNMIALGMIASVGVGAVALIASKLANKMGTSAHSTRPSKKVGSTKLRVDLAEGGQLTSFEQNCLGAPLTKLFRDCDDIAYTTYNGKRCVTVEGLLLTGYLYYGQHIYQASSVLLLVVARVIPQKILRTFNVLLLRWGVDSNTGVLTHAQSCTWHTASDEHHKLAAAVPVA